MSNGRLALVMALVMGTVALVGGCGLPAPTTTAEAFSPAATAVQATLAPEEMPTAAPLWTSTPKASSTPTARQQSATPATTQAATADTPASSDLDDSIVAVVNGTPITRENYDQKVAQARTYFLQQPGQNVKEEAGRQALERLQRQVLDWMIDQVLIEQAAKSLGITVSEVVVEAEVVRMKGADPERFEKWMAANGLTPKSLREQIHIDLVTSAVRDAVTASAPRKAEHVRIRHILVSDQATAQSALEQIRQGQDFRTVARQVSEDGNSRASGGELGFLPKGAMPPAFEEAAFALKPGKISEVVRSEFGFHIIQVMAIDPEHPVSPELWPVVQQQLFESWLADMRAKATIQRNVPGGGH